MNWIHDTIREFGRSIGLEALSMDDDGSLRLGTPNGGLVGVLDASDAVPPEVIVYRSVPLPFSPARKLRRALQLTDFRQRRVLPVQVGVHDGLVTLSMRVPLREFTTPSLEQALAELTRLHASLDGRG